MNNVYLLKNVMNHKFIVNEEEKKRILEMHINATKKLYLNEQGDTKITPGQPVVINGVTYKKPGITDINVLDDYRQTGSVLDNLKSLVSRGLKDARKPGYELDRMIRVWTAGPDNINTGHELSPTSRSPLKTGALALRQIVFDALNYAAQENVTGADFKQNPTGINNWYNTPGDRAIETPGDTMDINYLTKFYPNIVDVLANIITERDRMLKA